MISVHKKVENMEIGCLDHFLPYCLLYLFAQWSSGVFGSFTVVDSP